MCVPVVNESNNVNSVHSSLIPSKHYSADQAIPHKINHKINQITRSVSNQSPTDCAYNQTGTS